MKLRKRFLQTIWIMYLFSKITNLPTYYVFWMWMGVESNSYFAGNPKIHSKFQRVCTCRTTYLLFLIMQKLFVIMTKTLFLECIHYRIFLFNYKITSVISLFYKVKKSSSRSLLNCIFEWLVFSKFESRYLTFNIFVIFSEKLIKVWALGLMSIIKIMAIARQSMPFPLL